MDHKSLAAYPEAVQKVILANSEPVYDTSNREVFRKINNPLVQVLVDEIDRLMVRLVEGDASVKSGPTHA